MEWEPRNQPTKEPRTENVQVPVGLIDELIDWCSDELSLSIPQSQYRADIISFHDELISAKDGY